MQVTKGAISQMAKKPGKKGYPLKADDADNREKVLVQLAPKGRVVFEARRKYHRGLDEKIFTGVKGYREEQQELIRAFFLGVGRDIFCAFRSRCCYDPMDSAVPFQCKKEEGRSFLSF